MNLAEAIAGNPGAVSLPGLDQAWRWPGIIPRFQNAATVSTDGERILQTYTLDSYDEHVVRDVLAHARECTGELSADGPPLRILPEFTTPGRYFSLVVLVSPAVHRTYKAECPELHPVTFLAFPAYTAEYSGAETLVEAELRTLNPHGILLCDLNRAPNRYVKLRYQNLTTKGRTRGDTRGFSDPLTLARELERLENSPGSFIEFENYLGQVWRAEWDGQWVLTGTTDRRFGTAEDVLLFAEDALAGRALPH
ncbi:MAG: hypothetical protein DLM59_00685 [Pseudonocardiales bacterium]|nr:MAG: hypothetical protein DLM59_00685 [Pseudonocardiales bacterium]